MTGRERLTDRLTWTLGALYLVDGVAETTRVVATDSGGLPFWFGTLVGGGTLVVAGQVARRRAGLSCGLVVSGAFVGMPATMWTLLVPALAATVVVLVILRTGEALDRAEAARRA